ncbi:glycine betaine/proline transport system substrate-binding protein [Sediminihabitans luteus]|uniref:Glycine betaine/proline transport system substrate-binding protein n=1 Tax=Sediminihabitans luteus TaxID=1138585 RepID=A0A2M9CDR6_9CELL|nr:glycine betaine ABC transporter substrate-binding protein [Sediminihabitans luteus]PJJ70005.1 glycine betaine/proline transport system substrate-binding protein [Sediminihabitans luteus]GII99326.1 glycine/betaine ABC transporter substrate-binding protein [Sediminihabitans luteus]
MFSALSTRRRAAAAVTATVALGLGLTACSSDDSTDAAGGGDDMNVSIGIPSGWDEGIAVSNLWKAVLEDKGYTVDTQTADVGVIFTGLAGGDFDLMFDTWLPTTHASYIEKYGDDLEDLGTWYDDAKLTIAVNEDSPAQTIADLATMGDDYGNRLVGIEAGAGLTEATQDNVIPTYGLEDMDYVISSTPAMLAELKGATDKGDNIAVTLWRPHWAYDAFPIRDLEDPEGTLGAAESIHTYGPKGFSEDHSELAGWLEDFTLTDEQLFSLENTLFNDDAYTDDVDAGVQAWLDENPNFIDSVTGE